MLELTELQQELLRVIKQNTKKADFLSAADCRETSKELYKQMRVKPNHEYYISRILLSLKKMGKVKVSHKQTDKGLTRVIILL